MELRIDSHRMSALPARLSRISAVMALLAILACGDGSTKPPIDPPNQAPVATGGIPGQTVAAGETTAVDVAQYFSDPDGDALTFAAESSDTGVATVSVSGSTVTVFGAGKGTATTTVTATDPDGLSALQPFTVTVPNRPPVVVDSIPGLELNVGDSATMDVSQHFEDPDEDTLTFTVESSDTGVATVSVSGSTVTVFGAGKGTATTTVTATDPDGLSALQPFTVTVPNRPPVIVDSIPTRELTTWGDTAMIDLAEYFNDPDGDTLTYNAEGSDSGVVVVALSGRTVTLTAVARGVAEITATALDPDGLSASQSFAATVPNQVPVANSDSLPPLSLIAGGRTMVDISAAFIDPDGDTLTFAAETSSERVARVSVVDSTLVLVVAALAEGRTLVTVTARDPAGLSISQSFEVTVEENPDRAVLVQLYEATAGASWKRNDNWLTDKPLGEWYRVTVDSVGRVTELSLYSNGLIGPIPPEVGHLASLVTLSLSGNGLTGPIPPEVGNLASLVTLSLSRNGLTGPIPPELGNLPELRYLGLSRNGLTGPVPPELGNLSELRNLELIGNGLTGPLPRELVTLPALEFLHFYNNQGLCSPGTARFANWLGTLGYSGPYCNESDRAALRVLYETVSGADWNTTDGWLGGPVLDEWYGVTADSLGRVQSLNLTDNGLTGELPSELGNLAAMTELRLGDNELSGRLPLTLARLRLEVLHYDGTDLCVPAHAYFQDWLNSVPWHEGTGSQCALLSDNRDILVVLYETTQGSAWRRKDNWLTDAPIGSWYGVQTDTLGRVIRLRLGFNNLRGPIPPELGNLTEVEWLYLANNDLRGPIPPELGNLASLGSLSVSRNGLTGSIPPELGNFANLGFLDLSNNRLTGAIPMELGNLAEVEWLSLANNDLRGPIPPALGNLANLGSLDLSNNILTGPIPPAIGDLSELQTLSMDENYLTGPIPPLGRLPKLRTLSLADNRLTGPVPSEVGGLSLWWLDLADNRLMGPVPPGLGATGYLYDVRFHGNAEMAGRLPSSLTNSRVQYFSTGDTDLCAPTDTEFQAWLSRVRWARVRDCGAASLFLVQAIQSRDTRVPLIAGDDALLRVFLTASRANTERIPPVRATFFQDGAEVHVAEIPGKQGPIPTKVGEGDLQTSVNARIPGTAVQPGVELVVEVDPDGTADSTLGVVRRIPETGHLRIDVRAMPVFNLTAIPLVYYADPDSSLIDLVEAVAADPHGHELLEPTRSLLPVGGLMVTAHEPVEVSTGNQGILLSMVEWIRLAEGGEGHYLGIANTYGGAAYVGGRSSVSSPTPAIIAHEFGHNMNLGHAPCNVAGDPVYPYPGARIGAWGYDFLGDTLISPEVRDLMSYCWPNWVSDYHFTKALRFRLIDERAPSIATVRTPTRSLLLWGGVDAGGTPYLEPAFFVNAPVALPDPADEYRIAGQTSNGHELFSLRFAMPGVADGDGRASFAFVLPVQPEWAGSLASITLAGPGGAVTLDRDSDQPMTILRDPLTGQVRAILRDLPESAMGRAAREPNLRVLFSRGIPESSAWRR